MTSRIDQFTALLRKDENLANDLTAGQLHHVAALLAFSGCSLPLPVWTTREELDAAPPYTLLDDAEGQVFERWPDGTWRAVNWEGPGPVTDITLPVEVRYLR